MIRGQIVGDSAFASNVEQGQSDPSHAARIQSADLSGPEFDDMSDELAASDLRMKGEVVIVPAARMPSAMASVWLRKCGFIFMHVACLGVFLTGVNVQDLALCGSVYLLQMVGDRKSTRLNSSH